MKTIQPNPHSKGIKSIMISEKRIIKAQTTLNNFAQSLKNIRITNSFSEAIDLFKKCSERKGKIITTGMGKAGIAMRKFSSTLCSLGIPSCYLHPGEASHGDLGVLENNDVLFVASTSGKTREVLETISLAKDLGIKDIVGITSHIDSPIRKEASIVLDMGDIKEEGHLGLAPTTSILAMIAITDALSIIIAEENKFTAEDYSLRHHSGYLHDKAEEIKRNQRLN